MFFPKLAPRWLLIFIELSLISLVVLADRQTEIDLINNLTASSYNKDRRPEESVSINMTVFINQITAIEDSNQQMRSSINIMARWNDTRLAWDKADYDLDFVLVKADLLWLPDLVILNSASTSIFLSMDSKSLAYVDNSGEIVALYSVPALTTRCKMDVTKFPMDKQNCPIRISSWAYCDETIQLWIEDVVTEFYTENGVWSLANADDIDPEFKSEKDRFSYYDANCSMEVVSITLPLTRRPLYYMINMIFPSFILTIATIVCFALPAALQFSLSLTIFLNYSITSVRVASLMPIQSTNMPVVTWYFFGSMMITLVSFLWFVLDYVLRLFAYLPGWMVVVCSKIREWVRFLQTRSCSCKCAKKKIDVVESVVTISDEQEVQEEKKPMTEPLTEESCVKCQACGKCKIKEADKKSSDNKKTEFDKNMLCLNRIVFTITLTTIVVFDLSCWIFISSD